VYRVVPKCACSDHWTNHVLFRIMANSLMGISTIQNRGCTNGRKTVQPLITEQTLENQTISFASPGVRNPYTAGFSSFLTSICGISNAPSAANLVPLDAEIRDRSRRADDASKELDQIASFRPVRSAPRHHPAGAAMDPDRSLVGRRNRGHVQLRSICERRHLDKIICDRENSNDGMAKAFLDAIDTPHPVNLGGYPRFNEYPKATAPKRAIRRRLL